MKSRAANPAITCLAALLCVFLPAILTANERFLQESASALGMGGAGIAIANGRQALYLNPAGLGRQKETVYSPLSFIGIKNDDFDKVSDNINGLNGADTAFSRAANYARLSEIMAKTGYRQWSSEAYFISQKGFGIGAFYRDIEKYSVENPSSPQVKSEVYKDMSLSFSTAKSINEPLIIFKSRAVGWWGATLKAASRKSTKSCYFARDFAALDASDLKDTNQTGAALDFDFGVVYEVNSPLNPSLGLFVGNLLESKFSSEAGKLNRQLGIGAAIKPLTGDEKRSDKLVLAADYLNSGDGANSLSNLRLGMKLKLSKGLNLLCGLRGGYPTAGIDLRWYDCHFQAASYAEELGNRPGNKEDRRTAFSFIMNF